MSHRENGIGFLHLRTLSIQVQVSFEHEIHFEQTRNSQNSENSIFELEKFSKSFYFIFRTLISVNCVMHAKNCNFLWGHFQNEKTCWMKTFNHQRRIIRWYEDFLTMRKCDWKSEKMDKENDISGSLDCVFKVPMDPNSLDGLKSQEQFFFFLQFYTIPLTFLNSRVPLEPYLLIVKL